jgi:hypothetical protein
MYAALVTWPVIALAGPRVAWAAVPGPAMESPAAEGVNRITIAAPGHVTTGEEMAALLDTVVLVETWPSVDKRRAA